MARPRLKRTIKRIDAPSGDLYLIRPNATDIRIEQPSEEGLRLIAALDGGHTRPQLEREFGTEEVGNLLIQLEELGVVEDAADEDLIPAEVVARFDRQLRYFGDVSTGSPTPSECQRRLEGARIAVLGVGGLGGWSALSLACCGIGEMLLLDFDEVELSNLNRQVLYSEADIGRSKAEAAAERLSSFNSRMRVEVRHERLESEAEIAATIAGYDFVIDAVDWPAHEVERWINSACFAAGTPYIAMSHFPPVARVGPLYVPGRTGCYSCQEISLRRSYPLYDVGIEQGRAETSPAGTLGPACALVGSRVGLDVMHFLTGLTEPPTLGAVQIYDLQTGQVTREPIGAEPECPVCAHLQPAPASPLLEEAPG